MDSPPQTVTVRGGDFLCGKSGRKLCRIWSCEEKRNRGLGKKDYSILLNIVVIDFVFGVADYSFCAIMRKETMKMQTVEFI